ncbi:MAG: multidrug effflux MFS transporter [Acidimicrobiaceae bacterium]|nr:multidrug effflux MFS transporter [Acidimicrobiaceae bacterium]
MRNAEAARTAARLPSTRKLFLMIGGLTLFGPLCIDMYLPALPRLTDDLHASASSVQFSLTTCLIGLALGQVLIGPASDKFGRRRPLLGGLSLFVLASFACALATSAPMLASLRLLQGIGGAAGIVIGRAIVRDRYSGTDAARFFATLMLVTGAGPVLAPQIGAGLLELTSWRGVFLVLGLAGTLLFGMAAFRLPETLEPERRDEGGGVRAALLSMRRVGTHPVFLANALAAGIGFGSIFAYVSGSSFLLEDKFNLSPSVFGLLFAINGVGLVATGQLSARIVGRFGARRLLTVGLFAMAISGLSFLLIIETGVVGLAGVLPCLFLAMCANGMSAPNAMALAMNDFPNAAGSASALLGVLQFGVGALVAPLVGIGGKADATPMAVIMALSGVLAITVRVALLRFANPVVAEGREVEVLAAD